MQTNGKQTATHGHILRVFDSNKHDNASTALDSILSEMDSSVRFEGCKRVARIAYDDPRFEAHLHDHLITPSTTKTDAAYEGKPLADLPETRRRKIIRDLAEKSARTMIGPE